MEQNNGWIAVNRSVLKHWVHDDLEQFGAWIDLLLMANHESRKLPVNGEIVVIERGQMFTSYRSLAKRWSWSLGRVKRFIDVLEADEMVNASKTANGTLLTLVNYSVYQDLQNTNETKKERKRNADGTLTERSRNADGTLTERNNNINNINNDNKDNNVNNITPLNPPTGAKGVQYFPNDERLEEAFKAFLEMRKKRKNANTDYAIKLLLSKLEKLSTDPDTQVKIIEQSIENGWIGLFELRNNDHKTKTQGIADIWANVH